MFFQLDILQEKMQDKRYFSGGGRSYGSGLRGLCEIIDQAGAKLRGIGVAVEKGFQGGGDKLRASGKNLISLAIIESATPEEIRFRGE